MSSLSCTLGSYWCFRSCTVRSAFAISLSQLRRVLLNPDRVILHSLSSRAYPTLSKRGGSVWSVIDVHFVGRCSVSEFATSRGNRPESGSIRYWTDHWFLGATLLLNRPAAFAYSALLTKALFVTTFWGAKNLVLPNFVAIFFGVVQTTNGSETNSMTSVMDTWKHKCRQVRDCWLDFSTLWWIFFLGGGELVYVITKVMHLIHDVAFPRLWRLWWSFQDVACWMWIILQLACVYTTLEHANRQLRNRTNTGRLAWFNSLKWMRTSCRWPNTGF